MDSSLQQVTKNILKEMPNIPYTECPLDFRWEKDLILKINGFTFVAVPYVARSACKMLSHTSKTETSHALVMAWPSGIYWCYWESSRVVVSNMFVDWGVITTLHTPLRIHAFETICCAILHRVLHWFLCTRESPWTIKNPSTSVNCEAFWPLAVAI